jgi:hypothetical protein
MRNVLPPEALAIYLIQGCEVNVLERKRRAGPAKGDTRPAGPVNASMHTPTFPPADDENPHPRLAAVAANPSLTSWPRGRPRFAFDHETAVRAIKGAR